MAPGFTVSEMTEEYLAGRGGAAAPVFRPVLDPERLLLVRPIDPLTEKHTGEAVMAVEYGTGAGPGSIVLVLDEGGVPLECQGCLQAG